ncbi:transcriptional repressor [Loigolactobacillus backii]|uniref:ferric iron uptake transcriptional regulator n=1 Tax=Loigolactobacillus backii TaxID=375175 RepID=UPI0007F07B0E|nr:Fur family transcriptional regulator [Loigolactobacillus backii]ANK59580.1 transcriptional repressor [Loigolactobacillus backii]ANK64574.1 transcriptional repressor [Loigolactobacillus backii]ANK67031.1 transcriptional repressor [Loigolactobacillus backii]OLF70723.1 Fur family transcriptional regulator [Loigolactobacillus backii]PIO87675.1 transcriptional repressor [Loigolactobacillus backii]
MVDDKYVKKIKQQLHAAGFKLTPQREATVVSLLANEAGHLSAEEIYLRVKQTTPDIGLATVYRTLDILSELRIVNKVSFTDGLVRYDLRREGAQQHFHHHLLCVQCGKIEEIHEDLLADVEQVVASWYHFQVTDHKLTFQGLCADCQRKNKNQMAKD